MRDTLPGEEVADVPVPLAVVAVVRRLALHGVVVESAVYAAAVGAERLGRHPGYLYVERVEPLAVDVDESRPVLLYLHVGYPAARQYMGEGVPQQHEGGTDVVHPRYH